MKEKKIYTILSIVSLALLIASSRKQFTNSGQVVIPESFDDTLINPFDGIVWESAMSVYQPRGIRNNNPLNLRRSGDAWQGLSPVQNDPAFFQFISPEYGIRAGAIVLKNYYNRYGLDTVAKIITRFAPAAENNTVAYINAVCSKMNLQPNESFYVPNRIYELVNAIIKHENGINPYSQAVIVSGIDKAGLVANIA